MRQIFSFLKFCLLSFLAIYFLLSCQTPRVITITGGNLTNDSLTMVDEHGNPAYDIHVKFGGKIEWHLGDTSSNVKGFDSLPLKLSKSQIGVLVERPHKKNSTTWVGKVKDSVNLNGIYEEYYNINWKGSDGKDHKFDPRIQVP